MGENYENQFNLIKETKRFYADVFQIKCCHQEPEDLEENIRLGDRSMLHNRKREEDESEIWRKDNRSAGGQCLLLSPRQGIKRAVS